MNREKAQRHRKRKSYREMIVVGGFVAVCVSVIVREQPRRYRFGSQLLALGRGRKRATARRVPIDVPDRRAERRAP